MSLTPSHPHAPPLTVSKAKCRSSCASSAFPRSCRGWISQHVDFQMSEILRGPRETPPNSSWKTRSLCGVLHDVICLGKPRPDLQKTQKISRWPPSSGNHNTDAMKKTCSTCWESRRPRGAHGRVLRPLRTSSWTSTVRPSCRWSSWYSDAGSPACGGLQAKSQRKTGSQTFLKLRAAK